MTSAAKIVRFSGLLLASLSAGIFFGTRVALGLSSKAVVTSTYVEVQQATVRNRPVMGTLIPGAVAALVPTWVFELPINARC